MNGTLKRTANWVKDIEKRFLITAFGFASLVGAAVIVFSVFGGTSVDLRSSVPQETLGYIHAKDVGAVYGLISQNAGIRQRRDLSFLNGVEVAIAITGFEASEEELTEGASVLNVRPEFVAVARTSAWSWQISSLVDGPLNDFIKREYGEGTKRGTYSGEFGNLAVWTAADGRKAYAAVVEDRILLGNDLQSIEDCLAVSRGEKASLLEDNGLARFVSQNREAEILGYFPRRAVEKFADVAGVSAAVSGSDQDGIRAFIARLVPQLLRNSVNDVFWTSRNRNGFFEDKVEIATKESVSEVIAETMKSEKAELETLVEFLPANTASITRYSLRNPRISYRSLMVIAAKSADPASGRLISAFSGSLLEPYGVEDAELFLASAGPELITIQTKSTGEASAAIISVKERKPVLDSLIAAIGVGNKPEIRDGMELWSSNNELSISAAIGPRTLILGDTEVVLSCLQRKGKSAGITQNRVFDSLIRSGAQAVTISTDEGEYDFFGTDGTKQKNFYLSETSFSKRGVVRRYESKFGLIGSIAAGFGS